MEAETMKKTITILLALVITLSLIACGGTNVPSPTPEPTTDPNLIELTADNYSKYFDTSYICGCSNPKVSVASAGPYGLPLGNGRSTLYLYDSIGFSVDVKGVSQNYNYNDVVITFRCSGTYKDLVGTKGDTEGEKEFSREITVECNVAGNGNGKASISLSYNHYTESSLVDAQWEISSISGSVSRA